MKLSTPVLKTLLMTASLTMVVPILAHSTPPARPKADAPPDTPDAETVLPGSVVPHGEGWLSLSIADGTFVLSLYDAQKQPIDMPFVRATARWTVTEFAKRHDAEKLEMFMGTYEDELARGPDGWQFIRRTLSRRAQARFEATLRH